MKPLKEIINANYVIVPEFSYTGMGYMVVSRGDMTEYEWRVWKRTREVNSVKKLLSDGVMNKKTKKAIRVGLETIVESSEAVRWNPSEAWKIPGLNCRWKWPGMQKILHYKL